ncbi:MAG: ATP-binding cassette domain-containing protein [Planctomycetes bacterium]|nr:ATP-binding cassette domain-containing protein [Planctomycetota bacterium]
MIDVDHITKRFAGVTAVEDASFAVAKGEILGFLGPNGAGKTTTMRILSAYFPPTSGRCTVAGFDVVRDSLEVRRRVGYMPENVPLYPEMRVSEYLYYRARLKGVARRDRRPRFERVVEQCALQEVKDRVIGQLSKGYRQRVGIADACIADPPVLILDEPTIGLDPNQIRETRGLIKGLAHAHTVILSTHILPEVEMTCTRAAVIHRGRIMAVDTTERLTRGLSGGRRVVGELVGAPTGVESKLRAAAGGGTVSARARDGFTEFSVECAGEADPRAEVFRCAAANGWTLRELRFERRTLEEVFAQITRREEGALTPDPSPGGRGERKEPAA